MTAGNPTKAKRAAHRSFDNVSDLRALNIPIIPRAAAIVGNDLMRGDGVLVVSAFQFMRQLCCPSWRTPLTADFCEQLRDKVRRDIAPSTLTRGSTLTGSMPPFSTATGCTEASGRQKRWSHIFPTLTWSRTVTTRWCGMHGAARRRTTGFFGAFLSARRMVVLRSGTTILTLLSGARGPPDEAALHHHTLTTG